MQKEGGKKITKGHHSELTSASRTPIDMENLSQWPSLIAIRRMQNGK